MYMSCT